ncbi:MAG TPA: HAMP domain-containing sensor histidine kinase, partial [Acidimicrobiia bacterium]
MTANANSTRRRRTMRTRLVWSLVLVATAGILIAGVITVLAVQHGAEHSAQSNIEHKAANIVNDVKEVQGQAASGSAAPALRLRDLLDQVRSAVQVSDAHLVFVRADGGVATYNQVLSTTAGRRLIGNDSEASDLVALPKGVSADDLALDQVARGSTTTLRQNGNVYLAERVPSLTRTRATPVIIVSDVVDTGAARRAATAFIIAALIALAACVVVSTLLARRLTKPLTAIDTAARALAAGDLTARVDLGRRTDRETAEVAATLNQMASDLDGARRAERSFLQAVSHDLRTPLTSIRGYAEALADGTVDATDDQARVRAAEVITTESRRLERLVRDLLDLSRLDAHEFSLRPQPCDAAALAATTVAGFAPQAQSLGVELQAPDAGAVPADLDPERFGQIIANLVENALKYARSRVAVTFGASERDVTVTVADNGAGIPDAEQARVFERLYTARSAPGRPVGTGLGLTVVHELARAMGGGARLVSSGTDGTVFSVTVARGSTGVGF